MKRIITFLTLGLIAVGACSMLTAMPVSALENGATARSTVQPTFTTVLDESEQSVGLWAGKNYLLAGNNLSDQTDVHNGILLVAGNNLQLSSQSEYGFIFGNIIKFDGTTDRDLYIMGNEVTLTPEAEIGRDVFAAASALIVSGDLNGDLSATAGRVVFADDIIISGNVNLEAGEIEFGEHVQIDGKLVYNSSAETSGLGQVEYNSIETYQVEETDDSTQFVTSLYSKFLSMAGLFLAIALIIALYPAAKTKADAVDSTAKVGKSALIGLGALISTPLIAIFALFTIAAAPVGVILAVLYVIAIYLAQGFAGLWLGHIILSKLFKVSCNAFIEALVGIVVLGLLALVPVIGVLTGLGGLVIGLGLIINCIRPRSVNAKTLPKSKKAVSSKTAKKL